MDKKYLNLNYRPDIDGLRAIAVIFVLLFHFFPDFKLVGGFSGVDIFFVISGYLITGIILKNINKGNFSYIEFYKRRVLRIFPVLIVVMAFVWGVGFLCLYGDEFERLGKQIFAGAFYWSNINLWQESGYFDVSSRLKPLLHLWSLAVEEQFYIVWPVLCLLGCKLVQGPKKVAIWFLFFFGLSFVLNICLINKYPVAVFYLPFARAWELVFGGLLASAAYLPIEGRGGEKRLLWLFVSTNKTVNNCKSIVGLVLLVAALVFVKADAKFPGWYALLPTLGTGLIISAGKDSFINKFLLGNKIAVWIGLISYPLYLWHWPLLSFAIINVGDLPSAAVRSVILAISVVLAALSYYYLEPVFRKSTSNRGAKSVFLFVLMCSIGGVGWLTYHERGFPQRLETCSEQDRQLNAKNEELMNRSLANCSVVFPQWSKLNDNFCRMQREYGENSIAIIGDSHAGHLFPGLAELVEKKGKGGVEVFPASCAIPLMGIQTSTRTGNEDVDRMRRSGVALHRLAWDSILSDLNIEYVILAHALGCSASDVIDLENPDEVDIEKILRNGFDRTLRSLIKARKKVIVVLDNPGLPFEPSACRPRMFSKIFGSQACSFYSAIWDNAGFVRRYNSVVQEMKEKYPEIQIFDSAKYFKVENGKYSAVIDGRVMYVDVGHLNLDGSRYVARFLFDLLVW